MRTTRAYIASAGTASVMLGAALCMLVLVSAFVAFGSWPGETSGKQVDQVLLNEVTGPKQPAAVAVGAEAVKVARRAESQRKLNDATKRGKKRGGTGKTDDGNGTAVAQAPTGTAAPTTGAGGPLAQVPAAAGDTTDKVKQQTQNVTDTTKDVTNKVGDTVGNTVDQTSDQVNQVVDQVVGGVQDTTQQTTTQVQNTVGSTTNTVTNTVGGVLGH